MKLQASEKVIVLSIILLGFGLRAGLLSLTADIPFKADDATYFNMGQRLAADFPSALKMHKFLQRPPLLPFILAGTRMAIGPQPYHAKWIIVFFGTTSVALGYALGRRTFGHRAGLGAAAILALYPEFVISSTVLFTETPFITFNLASFLLLVGYTKKPHLKTLIAAGLLWAATILTRDQALYFTPIISLWLAWSYKGSFPQRLLIAIGFLSIVLIGLSPWIARNLLVTGRFAFVTQREGVQLFRWPGNHDPQLDLDAWCPQWQSLEGDNAAQQRFALLTTLDYIGRKPVEWGIRKVQLFWQEMTKVYSDAVERITLNIYGDVLPRYILVILWLTGIGFVILSVGWILGVFSAQGSPGRNLLLLWLGYNASLSIVLALIPKIQLILLASLALFSGYFWGQPLAALTRLRRHLLIILLIVVLLVLFLSNLHVDTYDIPEVAAPRTFIKRFCLF